MRKRRDALVLLVVVGLLMVAGCGGGDSAQSKVEGGEPTGGGAMAIPTIPALEPAQSWTPPEVIDVAYVQRVMNELERINLEIILEAYKTNRFSEVVEQKLNDIYAEPHLSAAISDVSEGSYAEHPELREDARPASVNVKFLRTARMDCINAIVDLDYRPVSKTQSDPIEFSVTLRRSESSLLWNPTHWRTSDWNGTSGATGKVDRCAGN